VGCSGRTSRPVFTSLLRAHFPHLTLVAQYLIDAYTESRPVLRVRMLVNKTDVVSTLTEIR
jgi:hypothetical protein